MSEKGLPALYQVHLIDSTLVDLKSQSGALDTGKAELEEAKALQSEVDRLGSHLQNLKGQQSHHITQAEMLERRAESHQEQLNEGQVSAQHAMAVEADIQTARGTAERERSSAKQFQDEIGQTESDLESNQTRFDDLRRSVAKKRKAAKAKHAEIETRFKELLTEREKRAALVPAPLLGQYNQIRKRTGGTGIAVITAEGTCDACGIRVPDKDQERAKEDEVVTCASCRRIYFWPVA